VAVAWGRGVGRRDGLEGGRGFCGNSDFDEGLNGNKQVGMCVDEKVVCLLVSLGILRLV
jgi:hypothetical protein